MTTGTTNDVESAREPSDDAMPVGDPEVSGIGIFRVSVDEAKAIMDDDPCVLAGVLVPEYHAGMSFPGDSL